MPVHSRTRVRGDPRISLGPGKSAKNLFTRLIRFVKAHRLESDKMRMTLLNPVLGENFEYEDLHRSPVLVKNLEDLHKTRLLNSVLGEEDLKVLLYAHYHTELECQRSARRKQALLALPPTVPHRGRSC